jgi:hypothetical protein
MCKLCKLCKCLEWDNKEGIHDYTQNKIQKICDVEDTGDMMRTEQDSQCTYNVIIRRVRVTTYVVEKQ